MNSGRIPELHLNCPTCHRDLGPTLAPIRRNGFAGGEVREGWQLCQCCHCGVAVKITALRIPPGGYSAEVVSTGPTDDDLPF